MKASPLEHAALGRQVVAQPGERKLLRVRHMVDDAADDCAALQAAVLAAGNLEAFVELSIDNPASDPARMTCALNVLTSCTLSVAPRGISEECASPSTTTTSASEADSWKSRITRSMSSSVRSDEIRRSASSSDIGSAGRRLVVARTKCVDRSGPEDFASG